jgi:hypothetical protein
MSAVVWPATVMLGNVGHVVSPSLVYQYFSFLLLGLLLHSSRILITHTHTTHSLSVLLLQWLLSLGISISSILPLAAMGFVCNGVLIGLVLVFSCVRRPKERSYESELEAFRGPQVQDSTASHPFDDKSIAAWEAAQKQQSQLGFTGSSASLPSGAAVAKPAPTPSAASSKRARDPLAFGDDDDDDSLHAKSVDPLNASGDDDPLLGRASVACMLLRLMVVMVVVTDFAKQLSPTATNHCCVLRIC